MKINLGGIRPPWQKSRGFFGGKLAPLNSKFRGFFGGKNIFARFARDRYHFHVRLEKVAVAKRFSAEQLLLTHLRGKKILFMEIAGAEGARETFEIFKSLFVRKDTAYSVLPCSIYESSCSSYCAQVRSDEPLFVWTFAGTPTYG